MQLLLGEDRGMASGRFNGSVVGRLSPKFSFSLAAEEVLWDEFLVRFAGCVRNPRLLRAAWRNHSLAERRKVYSGNRLTKDGDWR
jgi:hypothetical protein